MHWVDRGPEPDGLEKIRLRYTTGWVDHYGNKTRANPPSDDYWRRFHEDLYNAFFGLCAYCERRDRGEVEHFRPKSKFPERVYQWTNWVFSCHWCNHSKGEKWPAGGYVDPCARLRALRPEEFFGFDTTSGTIHPKDGLNVRRREKAEGMINHLGLNHRHQIEARLAWLWLVSQVVAGNPSNADLIRQLVSRSRELSSITRVKLAELGYRFTD